MSTTTLPAPAHTTEQLNVVTGGRPAWHTARRVIDGMVESYEPMSLTPENKDTRIATARERHGVIVDPEQIATDIGSGLPVHRILVPGTLAA